MMEILQNCGGVLRLSAGNNREPAMYLTKRSTKNKKSDTTTNVELDKLPTSNCKSRPSSLLITSESRDYTRQLSVPNTKTEFHQFAALTKEKDQCREKCNVCGICDNNNKESFTIQTLSKGNVNTHFKNQDGGIFVTVKDWISRNTTPASNSSKNKCDKFLNLEECSSAVENKLLDNNNDIFETTDFVKKNEQSFQSSSNKFNVEPIYAIVNKQKKREKSDFPAISRQLEMTEKRSVSAQSPAITISDSLLEIGLTSCDDTPDEEHYYEAISKNDNINNNLNESNTNIKLNKNIKRLVFT